MKGSRIWIITDTHLGHEKMPLYCGRPKDHSEIILKNLRENIKEGDTLIHLGDICIGNDEAWHFDLAGYLPKNVKRYLVRGNHDKKTDTWYLAHGWDFICDSFSDHFFGRYITFSHRPIEGTKNLNIHGHFHNTPPEKISIEWYNDLHKCLVLENLEYKPILLDKFIAKIK